MGVADVDSQAEQGVANQLNDLHPLLHRRNDHARLGFERQRHAR